MGYLIYQEDSFDGSWEGQSNTASFSGDGSLAEGVYFYSLILDDEVLEGYIYLR